MIKVNVLYFGAVREACDETPREEVEVQNGTDVGNLVDQLQQNTLAFAIIVSSTDGGQPIHRAAVDRSRRW